MIKYKLTHPEILRGLAQAGHGSKVLITDGNYPHNTGSSPNAVRVYLNLRPGMVTVPDVLAVITSAVSIEDATVMDPGDDSTPPHFVDYAELVGIPYLSRLSRHEFYVSCRSTDVALVVATGDSLHFANILLTVGALP